MRGSRLLAVAEELARRDRIDGSVREQLRASYGISEVEMDAAIIEDVSDTVSEVIPRVISQGALNAAEFGAALATHSRVWFELGLECARLHERGEL